MAVQALQCGTNVFDVAAVGEAEDKDFLVALTRAMEKLSKDFQTKMQDAELFVAQICPMADPHQSGNCPDKKIVKAPTAGHGFFEIHPRPGNSWHVVLGCSIEAVVECRRG